MILFLRTKQAIAHFHSFLTSCLGSSSSVFPTIAIQEPVSLLYLTETTVSSAQQTIQLASEPAANSQRAALRVFIAAHLQVFVNLHTNSFHPPSHVHFALSVLDHHSAWQLH